MFEPLDPVHCRTWVAISEALSNPDGKAPGATPCNAAMLSARASEPPPSPPPMPPPPAFNESTTAWRRWLVSELSSAACGKTGSCCATPAAICGCCCSCRANASM
eukprot:scaffold24836_cov57-Phaeocystis_antarctica.AAC.1